jgi:uncharacterized protein YndB with AHSA1/START domain
MADIRLNVVIKTTLDKVYQAVSTQEGIESWWCKDTTAKPEIGFVNVFTFGQYRNEMKVVELTPNKKVKWECINSVEEWIGTTVSFELEEKNGNTLLRFTHGGWKSASDFFAGCTYDWALFLKSLKTLGETGKGNPS